MSQVVLKVPERCSGAFRSHSNTELKCLQLKRFATNHMLRLISTNLSVSVPVSVPEP